MLYQFSKRAVIPFREAVEDTIDALKKEGFGVVTSIDMKDLLHRKLGVDFRKYAILGVCNPRYAYEALLEEDKLGIFLPCHVVVQEHDNGEVEISVVNPEFLTRDLDNLNLKTFATDTRLSLCHALEQVGGREPAS